MAKDIITHETRQTFARVGATIMGGGMGLRYFFLREEMARVGIETTEVLRTTGAGRQTESLPTADRFQGYYNTINWESREDVARILPAFEKIIGCVFDYHDPEMINAIKNTLDCDGLKINSVGKICRKPTGR